MLRGRPTVCQCGDRRDVHVHTNTRGRPTYCSFQQSCGCTGYRPKFTRLGWLLRELRGGR